jgi:hypothetical protein
VSWECSKARIPPGRDVNWQTAHDQVAASSAAQAGRDLIGQTQEDAGDAMRHAAARQPHRRAPPPVRRAAMSGAAPIPTWPDRLTSPGPKRLLAIDGGGVRGALAIGLLKAVETTLRARLGRPDLVLADYFDGRVPGCGVAPRR